MDGHSRRMAMKQAVEDAPAAHVNPDIFKLENKPKSVLGHEMGAGAKCLVCGDRCSGLDLHFWRKICKVCKCRLDDHDVHIKDLDHGQIIIGRLFDQEPAFERQMRISPPTLNSAAKENVRLAGAQRDAPRFDVLIRSSSPRGQEEATRYAWAPSQDDELVVKYMAQIPVQDRPIEGTEGAQRRRQRLQYQVPLHDIPEVDDTELTLDFPETEKAASEVDAEQKAQFVAILRTKVAGRGQIVELDDQIIQRRPLPGHDRGVQVDATGDAAAKRCQTCQKTLRAGEVGVVTKHGDPREAWHPNCFRCFTCEQPLVDMLYFYKDGNYYCGRHFGDTMYPRCGGCDELIFAKEYTRAEDKDWHLDHFCCFGCDLQLGGHKYMMKTHDKYGQQPYCLNCYMQLFARICQRCQEKIGPDVQRISHKELHWHANPQCFLCYECHGSLLSKRFIVKNEDVFCSSECKQTFNDRKRDQRQNGGDHAAK